MVPIESRVLATILDNNLIPDKAHIVVALSGGPDSIALLCLLAKMPGSYTLTAAYVDHNLRPEETQQEKKLIRELCQARGIAHTFESIDISSEIKRTGESIEECARRLRYLVLEKTRHDCGAEFIAVGHTADDQAEEILIRLIRGSSMKGLSGMSLKNNRIVRPLLGINKQDLLNYLKKQNIIYCFDSSNSSRQFLRNRVRLDLLPLLEKDFNPAIRRTLANTATILRDEDLYLHSVTEKIFKTIVSARHLREAESAVKELSVAARTFDAQQPAVQRRLIEKMCWDCDCRPTFSTIRDILKLAANSRTGAELHLPGGLRVIKTSTDIVFRVLSGRAGMLRESSAQQLDAAIAIASPGTYTVASLNRKLIIEISAEPPPGTDDSVLTVDAGLISFPLLLRAPLPGEKMRPLGAPGNKKISRLLSDRKIPRHLRHHYPVLLSEGNIVAVAGLIISDEFKISTETSRYLTIYWHEESPRASPGR